MSFLGWGKPKCSTGYREKAWVETRMRWLGEQLGMERLTRCEVILPTEEYFPDVYDATPEAAGRLFERVCGYMQVNRAGIEMQILRKDDMPGAVGWYKEKEGVICVADTRLDDPMALVATLTHKLAHHILIGCKLPKGEPDREWTMDLATVYFGLGIFRANATVSESRGLTERGEHWSSVRKQGYLPARMLAYAIALHTWLCGQQRPGWVGHLRLDAATAFNEGLLYLERTEDSLLRPDNLRRSDANSIDRLLDQLQSRSPSARVAALWELAQRGTVAASDPARTGLSSSESAKAVPAVVHCLTDGRTGIRAEAARTLAEFGPAAESAIHALIDALDDSEEEVRATAAFALGKLAGDCLKDSYHNSPLPLGEGQGVRAVGASVRNPNLPGRRGEAVVDENGTVSLGNVIESLTDHLDDPATLDTVAWSLAQFAAAARPALPRLLKSLKGELGRCSPTIDFLVYAVRAISPDPETEIRDLVASCDSDVQQQADHLLPENTSIPVPRGGAGWWPWADGSP